MTEKLKYLSCRLILCAGAGILLLFSALMLLLILCLRYGLGIFAVLFLTLAAVGYCCFVFRWLLIPYRETKKIY